MIQVQKIANFAEIYYDFDIWVMTEYKMELEFEIHLINIFCPTCYTPSIIHYDTDNDGYFEYWDKNATESINNLEFFDLLNYKSMVSAGFTYDWENGMDIIDSKL